MMGSRLEIAACPACAAADADCGKCCVEQAHTLVFAVFESKDFVPMSPKTSYVLSETRSTTLISEPPVPPPRFLL